MNADHLIKLRREKDKISLSNIKKKQRERELNILNTLLKESKTNVHERKKDAQRLKLAALNFEAKQDIVKDIDISDDEIDFAALDKAIADIDLSSDEDDNNVQNDMKHSKWTSDRELLKHAELVKCLNIQTQPEILDFNYSPVIAAHESVSQSVTVKLVNTTADVTYTLPSPATFKSMNPLFPAAGVLELHRCFTIKKLLPKKSDPTTAQGWNRHFNSLSDKPEDLKPEKVDFVSPGGCVRFHIDFVPTPEFHAHYRNWKNELLTDHISSASDDSFVDNVLSLNCIWSVVPRVHGKNGKVSQVRHERVSLPVRLSEPRPILEVDPSSAFHAKKNSEGSQVWQCDEIWIDAGDGWLSDERQTTFCRPLKLVNRGSVGVWVHAQCVSPGVECMFFI